MHRAARRSSPVSQDEIAALAAFTATLPPVIATLPLRQQQVVIGRYYEGRTCEELAQVLEVQPATVRSLLRDGLASLRQKLDGAG